MQESLMRSERAAGQTDLALQEERQVALKMVTRPFQADQRQTIKAMPLNKVRFEIVDAITEKGLSFDPSVGSEAGNVSCPFCGTVADRDYVKAEGQASSIQHQLMAIVCTKPGKKGKVYLSGDDYPAFLPNDEALRKKIDALSNRTGLSVPDEPIEANPRSMDTQHFGFGKWGTYLLLVKY